MGCAERQGELGTGVIDSKGGMMAQCLVLCTCVLHHMVNKGVKKHLYMFKDFRRCCFLV